MPISIQSRRRRNLRVVLAALGGRPPVAIHSSSALFKWYARAVAERQQLLAALAVYLRRKFGYELRIPALPLAGAATAARQNGEPIEALQGNLRQYDTAIVESLGSCPYFGFVEYTGEHECVVRYCDSTNEYGLLQVTHHVRTHEHHLVQVRERKVTDLDVTLPSEKRRIVNELPTCVVEYVRIIVGMLVLQKEGDGGKVRRDHAVGHKLREAGRAAVKYGPGAVGGVAAGAAAAGIVAGIASMISAASSAAAAAASTAAVVAVADPAIVIGDLVISGWIEE